MSVRSQVTLVIPSYQRGPKIGPTLASVFAQTRVPDEVLVVNDGACTATREFVAQEFSTAKVLDVPHGGAALARNRGAEAATQPVLIFLDDDDTVLPHAVETLLRQLAMFPEARASHADHTFTDLRTGEHRPNHHATLPNFARLRQTRPLREAGGVRLYGKDLYYAMLRGNLLQQPWAVYRDTYLAVGGFRPGLVSADDWDVYLRVTRLFPVAVSDEVIGNHFVEADRLHLTLDPRQREGQMAAAHGQLALAGWRDPRASVTLRRVLGGHYKAIGDEATLPRQAWRAYLRSFRAWPFDPVVAARALVIFPMKAVFAGHPPEARS